MEGGMDKSKLCFPAPIFWGSFWGSLKILEGHAKPFILLTKKYLGELKPTILSASSQ
jgi:hypothetical protein